MADTTEKVFSYLYFKAKELNGKVVPGQFEQLKVRFLYRAMSEIQAGRVHMYNYSAGKFSKIVCLKNDAKSKAEVEKIDCPLCKREKFGTPATKFFAFVVDLNDDNKLKLLEINFSLGKAIDDLAEIKGAPLHDMVFTLVKKGIGKDTTYLPMWEETTKGFSVSEYFGLLGLSKYPQIVGKVEDRAPVMVLSREQIDNFIAGKYPWSTNEDGASTTKKYAVLGSTVTLRGEHNAIAEDLGADELPSEFNTTTEEVESVDEESSFF